MLSLADLFLPSKKPSAVLARDGAAVVRNFLDHAEAAKLKAAVEELFSTFAACPGFAQAETAYHYQTRQAIWLGELPVFLQANNRSLLPRYEALIDRVSQRTRAL